MKKHTNSRTVQHLRDQGYLAENVEHWNAHAGFRRDLFNLIDVFAIGMQTVLGVQATTSPQLSKHRSNLLANPNLVPWLQSGARCQLWSWRLVSLGKRKVWRPRIEEFFLQDGKPVVQPVEPSLTDRQLDKILEENSKKTSPKHLKTSLKPSPNLIHHP